MSLETQMDVNPVIWPQPKFSHVQQTPTLLKQKIVRLKEKFESRPIWSWFYVGRLSHVLINKFWEVHLIETDRQRNCNWKMLVGESIVFFFVLCWCLKFNFFLETLIVLTRSWLKEFFLSGLNLTLITIFVETMMRKYRCRHGSFLPRLHIFIF